MNKAYVLLSGGIDSAVCAALAKKEFNSVRGISFKYGQKHEKEIWCAQRITQALKIDWTMVDITNVMTTGGLTDPDQEIPDSSYKDLGEGVSPAYVPFRNGIMLSILTGMASVDPQALTVYHGAHADDAAGWAYPDCTPEFMGGMANAIYVGTYHKIRLRTPLIHLQKWEVVRMGHALHVPFTLTWSCYKGGELHCGKCPTCIDRKQAFSGAGIIDPTTYES